MDRWIEAFGRCPLACPWCGHYSSRVQLNYRSLHIKAGRPHNHAVNQPDKTVIGHSGRQFTFSKLLSHQWLHLKERCVPSELLFRTLILMQVIKAAKNSLQYLVSISPSPLTLSAFLRQPSVLIALVLASFDTKNSLYQVSIHSPFQELMCSHTQSKTWSDYISNHDLPLSLHQHLYTEALCA